MIEEEGAGMWKVHEKDGAVPGGLENARVGGRGVGWLKGRAKERQTAFGAFLGNLVLF